MHPRPVKKHKTVDAQGQRTGKCSCGEMKLVYRSLAYSYKRSERSLAKLIKFSCRCKGEAPNGEETWPQHGQSVLQLWQLEHHRWAPRNAAC